MNCAGGLQAPARLITDSCFSPSIYGPPRFTLGPKLVGQKNEVHNLQNGPRNKVSKHSNICSMTFLDQPHVKKCSSLTP